MATTNTPSCVVVCIVLGLSVTVQQVTAPPPLFVELRAQKEEDLREKSGTESDTYSDKFTVDIDPSRTRYLNLNQVDLKNEFKFTEDLYLDPKQNDIKHNEFDKTDSSRYTQSDTASDGVLRENRPIDLDNLEQEGLYVVEEFEPLPMPTNFSQYDTNKDGYIDLEELMVATQAQENAALALHASDIDGDGRLSNKEFNDAPWIIGEENHNLESASDDTDESYDDRYNEHPHNGDERGDDRYNEHQYTGDEKGNDSAMYTEIHVT
ncbi:uncharacterized protein [Argopecten irradians]|uniref:uncharacterized protein n=1 Tax=Argopecten irradians TaxID=31199 RepID=UPI003721C1D3